MKTETMKDIFLNDLNIGDKVIVTRLKVPLRAIIENIDDDAVSVRMFDFCYDALSANRYKTYKSRWIDKSEPSKPNIWSHRFTFRFPNKYCDNIMKLNWEFHSLEVLHYKTEHPESLLKKTNKKKVNAKKKPRIKSFEINNKHWMSENLNVLTFRNGDPIPIITDKKEWKKAAKNSLPACCYYDNNKEEYGHRGLLYNVYALKDPRGLCPDGWHIATLTELNELVRQSDGWQSAAKYLRSSKGWFDGPFFIKSYFNGQPNGMREANGSFKGEGYNGCWFIDDEKGGFKFLILSGDRIDAALFPVMHDSVAMSVRCVKD